MEGAEEGVRGRGGRGRPGGGGGERANFPSANLAGRRARRVLRWRFRIPGISPGSGARPGGDGAGGCGRGRGGAARVRTRSFRVARGSPGPRRGRRGVGERKDTGDREGAPLRGSAAHVAELLQRLAGVHRGRGDGPERRVRARVVVCLRRRHHRARVTVERAVARVARVAATGFPHVAEARDPTALGELFTTNAERIAEALAAAISPIERGREVRLVRGEVPETRAGVHGPCLGRRGGRVARVRRGMASPAFAPPKQCRERRIESTRTDAPQRSPRSHVGAYRISTREIVCAPV